MKKVLITFVIVMGLIVSSVGTAFAFSPGAAVLSTSQQQAKAMIEMAEMQKLATYYNLDSAKLDGSESITLPGMDPATRTAQEWFDYACGLLDEAKTDYDAGNYWDALDKAELAKDIFDYLNNYCGGTIGYWKIKGKKVESWQGMLAYEDIFGGGDADYNDLVVEMKADLLYGKKKDLRQMFLQFDAKARGAEFNHQLSLGLVAPIKGTWTATIRNYDMDGMLTGVRIIKGKNSIGTNGYIDINNQPHGGPFLVFPQTQSSDASARDGVFPGVGHVNVDRTVDVTPQPGARATIRLVLDNPGRNKGLSIDDFNLPFDPYLWVWDPTKSEPMYGWGLHLPGSTGNSEFELFSYREEEHGGLKSPFEPGQDLPYVLAIPGTPGTPGTWQWPTESTFIIEAYPDFVDWVNNGLPEGVDWWSNLADSSKVY